MFTGSLLPTNTQDDSNTVDPVISKALYFLCCAGCCIIDLFRVYDFRCCLLKTVLDFRINRECKKLLFFFLIFHGKFTIANIAKLKQQRN